MNTLKTSVISVFASFITLAVILSGAHAKDIVGTRNLKDDSIVKTTAKTTDVAAKAVSDLHNHVDKTTLKAFAKSTSDSSMLARERELKAGAIKLERTLSVRLLELSLLFRLAFAHAL